MSGTEGFPGVKENSSMINDLPVEVSHSTKSGNSLESFVAHQVSSAPDNGSHQSYPQVSNQPLQYSNAVPLYNSQVQSFPTTVDPFSNQVRMENSVDHDPSLIRNPPVPPSNSNISSFQLPFSQGHIPLGPINIASQGPLLSNGNYSGLKHMHPHNLTTTESFVAMPSQPLVHSQYIPTNSGQSNSHASISGSANLNLPSSHSMQVNSEMMLGRANILPSHSVNSSHTSLSVPVHNLSQETHNMQSNLGNQYVQMNPRSVGIHSNQHSQLHQIPHQHHTAQPPSNLGSLSNNSHSISLSNQSFYGNNNSTQSQGAQHQSQSAFPGRTAGPRNWHSNDHVQLRETVAEEIVKILKSRKPNANDNWHDKLPHMARRLEDALYFDASTLEEYADRNTLKQRLQQLALSMGNSKNQHPKPSAPSMAPVPQGPPHLHATNSQNQATLNQSNSHSQMTRGSVQAPSYSQSVSYQGQTHLQNLSLPHQQQNLNNPSYVSYQSQQSQQVQRAQQSNQYSQMNPALSHSVANAPVNIGQNIYHTTTIEYPTQLPHGNTNNQARAVTSSSGALIQQANAGQSYHNDSQSDSYQRVYPPSGLSNISGVPISATPTYPKSNEDHQAHYQSHQLPQRTILPQHAQMHSNQPVAGNHTVPPVQQTTDEHRKQVLKQQQQRLLLLRHASKCPHENGRCPVTPHCWNMKQLWKHIMSCKDQDCKVAHCVSSRYVLSHYSKCKEPTCPVCGPVREAIKRNYERSRDVVKMARNPNPHGLNQVAISAAVPGSVAPGNMSVPPSLPPTKAEEPEKKKLRKKSDVLSVSQPTPPVAKPIEIKQPPRKIYPLDPISSAIYSFSNEQIQSHFRTIHEGLRLTVAKIKEMCKPLVEELFRIPHAQGVFGAPVDPIALGLNDYFDIVKTPMDLGTVMRKLDSGSYRDLINFISDVHLTFDNAMLYNPKNTDVYLLAGNLKREFDKRYKAKIADFEKIIEENRRNKEACLICGEIALKYEPPVYYCNGTCAQRIRRNAVFYSNSANTYHWCSVCFNAIRENDSIRLPDCTITKAELAANKKKHIEESGEGWVECEGGCRRWVHQICALFNNRRNVSDDVSYVCPLCLQEKRRKSPLEDIVAPSTKKMRAADLPVSTLSDFLEKRIYKRLELAYEEAASKFGLSLDQVERCPPLTLRQVSCVDKLQMVREGFYVRYKEKGYPTDFPCRSKCLVLFQNIDGQDVILFGMYVYEYGHKCPQPNQRRVYISYLDSVHYLRPKQYRTMVYHEILISYLDYMKARGFHTCHIWACPPQKGDDYILYVHPPDQKTPKPQILRVWYDEMLKKCMERGIVCEITDLHTEFLADPSIEATSLPYFEGDYWVNEAEVIIKNFGDGKKDDDVFDENGMKSKRRSKTKRPSKATLGTAIPGKGERDPLMAKLASIIEPMKDTFFVARLHPKEFAEKFLQPETVSGKENENESKEKTDKELQEEALSGQDIVPQLPDVPTGKGTKRSREESDEVETDIGGDENSDDDGFARDAAFISANNERTDTFNPSDPSESTLNRLPSDFSQYESKSEFSSVPSDSLNPENPAIDVHQTVNHEVCKTQSNFSLKKKLILCGEDMPELPNDTEDVDDTQECEHFDTRQAFLNLCQGNHYQYDQLRRAKHSSMMVLYHLHNPDAPKFVPSCGNCHIDILTGNRYRCEKCELDYCQACYSRVGPVIHNHPLRMISGSNTAPTKLTEEQRRERQRSIQLHMQLLNHAANCIKCESRNCAKMKDFLQHESQCKIKSSGGCRLCSRISNLLNIHARSCRIENCKVPQCLKLREQFRQLALSQQRMDDRRRKKMNSEYNRSGSNESKTEDDDS